ncbi:MAG: hypothetical protein IJU50_00725, partial [Lachnospiraceae bacterium]|nr:hypothetical protein [Lachnospiraceae bacterium]
GWQPFLLPNFWYRFFRVQNWTFGGVRYGISAQSRLEPENQVTEQTLNTILFFSLDVNTKS